MARAADAAPIVLRWRQETTRLGRTSLKSTLLSFVDSAGEDLNDVATAFTLHYLTVCDCLIVVLDPFALPGARAKLNLPDAAIKVNDDVPLDVINNITEMLRIEHNVKKRQKIAIPVAIVFTKIDAFFPTLDRGNPLMAGTSEVRAYDNADGQAVHENMLALLHEWNAQDIDAHMRFNYADFRYFGVSALGAEPNYERLHRGRGRSPAAPCRGPRPVAAVQGRNGAVGMTAEVFDRLLYTDCKPGTGRGAGGGFQIQAQSAGVDRAQAKLAVGWLLYDVQLPWLTQQRPVADFPPGLAHASGDGYGTAQGRYVGKVATGGRDGNHLADCLLTRDGKRYGPIRPAQLWRSALWRDRALGQRELPAARRRRPGGGPLTAGRASPTGRGPPGARTAARPAAQRARGAGRQARGDRRRRPDEAMTWIAAATLLLP